MIGRILATAVVLVALAATARAQPARQAEKLFDEGTTLYKAGDYDAAIEKFRAGFDLSKDPIFTFNIAVAQRKKGDCVAALASYQEYLRLAPKAPDRARVEERIVEMKACAEKQQGDTTAPPDTTAPVDTTPTQAPAPAVQTPAVETTTTAPEADRGGGRSLLLPLLVGGTGVVAAGVGGVLLWTARSKYNDLEDSCAPNCATSDWDGYDTRTTAGNVLLIGGAALVATGAVLWFLQPGGDETPGAATAARLHVGPGGVALSGRF